jgi:hypothetical protein
MATTSFTFTNSTSAHTGYSPLTIVFKPSTYSLLSGQFLSQVIYEFPDKTAKRYYTFCASTDASGTYKDIDTRADVVYTLPGTDIDPETGSTYVINISAIVAPSFTVYPYSISATVLLPYTSKNPLTATNQPYAFEEIHLLRSHAWGASNNQIFILETKNPNYILVNYL